MHILIGICYNLLEYTYIYVYIRTNNVNTLYRIYINKYDWMIYQICFYYFLCINYSCCIKYSGNILTDVIVWTVLEIKL